MIECWDQPLPTLITSVDFNYEDDLYADNDGSHDDENDVDDVGDDE